MSAALAALLPVRLPFTLRLYRAASSLLGPLAEPVLRRRARAGKEDPSRLGERLGHAGTARPAGPLVWMHGASVGESMLFLPLIEAFRRRRPDVSLLVTSGTRTSADLLARRLPPGVTHQYVPVDTPEAVGRFLDHWRPGLAIFAEGELWPNLLLEAQARGVSLALVNARMGERSRRGWARVPVSARRLLQAFDTLLAADTATAEAMSRLAERPVQAVGNLKLAAPPPPVDPAGLALLDSRVGARPVWLAASTHAGEDEIVLDAHRRVRLIQPRTLLILAPRHPSRGAEITDRAWKLGLPSARRSLGQFPEPDTAVYVADTLGEMGMLYAASPITLMAGSLVRGIGGHNPVEPARLGSVILTGTEVANFADLYEALQQAGGARYVADAESLATAILDLADDPTTRGAMRAAADRVVSAGAGAFDATLEALLALFPADTGPPEGAHARALTTDDAGAGHARTVSERGRRARA